MGLKVFKYELKSGICHVDMPKAAKILSCEFQGESAFVWALVDPSNDEEVRSFAVFGTGHQLPDDIYLAKYVGTMFKDNWGLVFHVFVYA